MTPAAVRTGCGKSQTARAVGEVLRRHGHKVVAIRHSIPYGDLAVQACQRFATKVDFAAAHTTVEEEEEYQPWLDHEIPAMGYDDAQVRDLEATINAVPREVVVDGSPAKLARIMTIERPVVNVGYELRQASTGALAALLAECRLIER